jgi:carboxymethylenebutenolidase
MSKIEIKTKDGVCPCYEFRPIHQSAPWPAVLVFMDGIGIRPAMIHLAERLSTNGFYVLMPDLFYRSGPYEPMNGKTVFTDPDARAKLMAKFGTAKPAQIMSDVPFFLDHIAAQPDVKKGPVGTTGYCMGGLMSLTAAGTFPDKIKVACSFHGGNLASDKPESPHLLADKMKARVYCAGAIEDPSFPDEMKATLGDALTKGGVNHTIETYPAKHGWTFFDTPVYDAGQSEHHWQALVKEMEALRA